jgi:hypothetical protein
MKDRREPATVGSQAAVLASVVRLVDAVIAVSGLNSDRETQKRVEAAQNAMLLTMNAVEHAVAVLQAVCDGAEPEGNA